MSKVREKFIVNEKGRRVGVVLGVKEYERIQRDLEELELIRVYDEAMARGETPVPFEQACEEIERSRK